MPAKIPNCGGVTPDMCERALHVERVGAAGPVMIEIETECLGVRPQTRDLIWVRQITIHHRGDGANARRTGPKIFAKPANEVVGEGLHFER